MDRYLITKLPAIYADTVATNKIKAHTPSVFQNIFAAKSSILSEKSPFREHLRHVKVQFSPFDKDLGLQTLNVAFQYIPGEIIAHHSKYNKGLALLASMFTSKQYFNAVRYVKAAAKQLDKKVPANYHTRLKNILSNAPHSIFDQLYPAALRSFIVYSILTQAGIAVKYDTAEYDLDIENLDVFKELNIDIEKIKDRTSWTAETEIRGKAEEDDTETILTLSKEEQIKTKLLLIIEYSMRSRLVRFLAEGKYDISPDTIKTYLNLRKLISRKKGAFVFNTIGSVFENTSSGIIGNNKRVTIKSPLKDNFSVKIENGIATLEVENKESLIEILTEWYINKITEGHTEEYNTNLNSSSIDALRNVVYSIVSDSISAMTSEKIKVDFNAKDEQSNVVGPYDAIKKMFNALYLMTLHNILVNTRRLYGIAVVEKLEPEYKTYEMYLPMRLTRNSPVMLIKRTVHIMHKLNVKLNIPRLSVFTNLRGALFTDIYTLFDTLYKAADSADLNDVKIEVISDIVNNRYVKDLTELAASLIATAKADTSVTGNENWNRIDDAAKTFETYISSLLSNLAASTTTEINQTTFFDALEKYLDAIDEIFISKDLNKTKVNTPAISGSLIDTIYSNNFYDAIIDMFTNTLRAFEETITAHLLDGALNLHDIKGSRSVDTIAELNTVLKNNKGEKAPQYSSLGEIVAALRAQNREEYNNVRHSIAGFIYALMSFVVYIVSAIIIAILSDYAHNIDKYVASDSLEKLTVDVYGKLYNIITVFVKLTNLLGSGLITYVHNAGIITTDAGMSTNASLNLSGRVRNVTTAVQTLLKSMLVGFEPLMNLGSTTGSTTAERVGTGSGRGYILAEVVGETLYRRLKSISESFGKVKQERRNLNQSNQREQQILDEFYEGLKIDFKQISDAIYNNLGVSIDPEQITRQFIPFNAIKRPKAKFHWVGNVRVPAPEDERAREIERTEYSESYLVVSAPTDIKWTSFVTLALLGAGSLLYNPIVNIGVYVLPDASSMTGATLQQLSELAEYCFTLLDYDVSRFIDDAAVTDVAAYFSKAVKKAASSTQQQLIGDAQPDTIDNADDATL